MWHTQNLAHLNLEVSRVLVHIPFAAERWIDGIGPQRHPLPNLRHRCETGERYGGTNSAFQDIGEHFPWLHDDIRGLTALTAAHISITCPQRVNHESTKEARHAA